VVEPRGRSATLSERGGSSPAGHGSGALLAVDHVGKRFGRQVALRDLSLCVARGEVVGLVGPNGAGKSTAFRITCGLLRADTGTVTLAGCDVQRDARTFRAQIGVLIEGPAFWPGLSAAEHLRYLSRVRGCDDGGRVARTLEEVGLAPGSRKPVGKFSLGMKQRLGIAMAILHDPRLLVLDEPMNGLDPVGMASLREFLRGLGTRRGVGVLVSSHLLHEIEQICDRVLFIRDGRLLDTATLSGGDLAETETVLLETGDDPLAGDLLRREVFVRELVELPVGLECRVAAHHVPRLAPLLVAAGIAIRQITPRRRSLEDLYLSHYGGPSRGGIE
jgi:ABC-2 type transport system ATP-binding protein